MSTAPIETRYAGCLFRSRLEFLHDERAACKSFGRGLIEAVAAARSARFGQKASGSDKPELQ